MKELVLGVVDVPYDNGGKRAAPKLAKKGKVPRAKAKQVAEEEGVPPSSGSSATTTVQVANWLESRYHVMEVFYLEHQDSITQALVNSLEGALENLYMGAPPGDPFAGAEQVVVADFRKFLLTGEIETLGYPGVPTQAALERRSLRFKSGRAGAQRPSFIDTSTYEMSMRAWVE